MPIRNLARRSGGEREGVIIVEREREREIEQNSTFSCARIMNRKQQGLLKNWGKWGDFESKIVGEGRKRWDL